MPDVPHYLLIEKHQLEKQYLSLLQQTIQAQRTQAQRTLTALGLKQAEQWWRGLVIYLFPHGVSCPQWTTLVSCNNDLWLGRRHQVRWVCSSLLGSYAQFGKGKWHNRVRAVKVQVLWHSGILPITWLPTVINTVQFRGSLHTLSPDILDIRALFRLHVQHATCIKSTTTFIPICFHADIL